VIPSLEMKANAGETSNNVRPKAMVRVNLNGFPLYFSRYILEDPNDVPCRIGLAYINRAEEWS